MDAATERALIARAKAGDTDAVDELMRAGEPWIRRLTSNHLLPGLELADCEQVARLAYWQSIRRFDLRRKGRLSTFATRRIRGAIVDLHRDQAGLIRLPRRATDRGEPRPKIMHLSQVVTQNDQGEDVEVLMPVDPREPCDREDAARRVYRFLRIVCRDDRERLMVLMYAAGERMKSIGQQMGLSESRVSQLLAEIEHRSGIDIQSLRVVGRRSREGQRQGAKTRRRQEE